MRDTTLDQSHDGASSDFARCFSRELAQSFRVASSICRPCAHRLRARARAAGQAAVRRCYGVAPNEMGSRQNSLGGSGVLSLRHFGLAGFRSRTRLRSSGFPKKTPPGSKSASPEAKYISLSGTTMEVFLASLGLQTVNSKCRRSGLHPMW
jgi:hypothetical protein